MDSILEEQNQLAAWSYCTDRGLPHQWVKTEVSPLASRQVQEHAGREGWYVCRRCPATGWGSEVGRA